MKKKSVQLTSLLRKQRGVKLNNTPKKSNKQFVIFGIIAVTFIFFCGLTIFKTQTKPVLETPRSVMKKIPPDVKRTLEKQVESATTSAVFRVPILLYHYVEYVKDKKDTIRQSLNINPNTFDTQVSTLVKAEYTFMTAKELGLVLDGKMRLPVNPVLLTFDDGHWDFDTVVLPILKKYNVKATAYIISGFIGGSDFMSQQQLQEVEDSGLVDVGAHTVHHISLKGKLAPLVQFEVEESKKWLENTYHIPVVSFAYPDGAFDQQAINAVHDAGFTTAVSTIPGIIQSGQNRFFLYRLRPGYRTGQSLLNYLRQSSFKAY